MNEGETINLPFLPPIGQLFEGGHRYSMPPMPHAVGIAGENCLENLKS